jgi:hypothetical protein
LSVIGGLRPKGARDTGVVPQGRRGGATMSPQGRSPGLCARGAGPEGVMVAGDGLSGPSPFWLAILRSPTSPRGSRFIRIKD